MTHGDVAPLGRVWLTPADVQQMTGFSRTEVYGALQSGELVGHQRSKHKQWRIRREDVDAWVRGDTKATA